MKQGRKATNLKGQRFDKTLVIKREGSASNGGATWLCQCSCKTFFIKEASDLKRGYIYCPKCMEKVRSAKISKAHTILYNVQASSASCQHPDCNKEAILDSRTEAYDRLCYEHFMNTIPYQPVGIVSTLAGV